MSNGDDRITANTPFPELNDVLRVLVDSVRGILCDNFGGAYLQGSFAVGDSELTEIDP
jgi:hypothetical protein